MTVTPHPTIDALPAAPVRGMAGFAAAVGAFLTALVTFRTQAQAAGVAAQANAQASEDAATDAEGAASAAIMGTDYAATTTATLNLTQTAQSATLQQTGKGFAVNDQIALVLRANDAVRMTAVITSFNAGTGLMGFTVTRAPGVGTGTGWLVMSKAFEGLSPEEVTKASLAFAVAL